MNKNKFAEFTTSVETSFAVKVGGLWLDLEKFTDFAQFKAVVLDLCGSPKNFRVEDYKGIPDEMAERFSFTNVYLFEDAFEDFQLFAMADAETREAYGVYLEYISSWGVGSYEDFTDKYRGCFSSETEFTEQFVDEIGLLAGVDSNIAMYFDYSAYARDLFLNGDFTYCNGYVFGC